MNGAITFLVLHFFFFISISGFGLGLCGVETMEDKATDSIELRAMAGW